MSIMFLFIAVIANIMTIATMLGHQPESLTYIALGVTTIFYILHEFAEKLETTKHNQKISSLEAKAKELDDRLVCHEEFDEDCYHDIGNRLNYLETKHLSDAKENAEKLEKYKENNLSEEDRDFLNKF